MRVGLGGIRTHAQKATSVNDTMHLVVQLRMLLTGCHQRITPLFMLFENCGLWEMRGVPWNAQLLQNYNRLHLLPSH